MNGSLPMHDDVPAILLEPEPADAVRDLDAALGDAIPPLERGARLRSVVARWPTFLDGWARLAEWAREAGDDVAAYAFARTGYHRGLDRIRKAGWRGQGRVPWSHAPNRGFLHGVHELMLAANAIAERDEARRCRQFLLDLDPDDALEVGNFHIDASGD